MCLVNAWLTYREKQERLSVASKDILDLFDFRENVAEALCTAELNPPRPRGRPSLESLLNYVVVPMKKTRPAVMPNADARYDGYDHWPEVIAQKSAQRCKLEYCSKSSRTKCTKCNVYLCLSSDRNCFKSFHN